MFKLKLIKKPILFKLKCNFSFPPIVLANLQEKEVTPTKEKQEVVADKNYDGLSKVTVDKIPAEYIIPTGNIEIIENGIYNVREKETANVNIPMLKLGTKNITENGVYKASDDNLDGYSEVTVGIKSLFTGHYDAEGLKQIGWSDEEIEYYQNYGVQWNESEDEYFKLTQTELAGDDSKNTRFLPKNTTKTNFNDYRKLLAIPNIDISGVTSIDSMFSNCYTLPIIPLLNISNITNMTNTFSNCYSLKTIPLLDTSNVTNMESCFSSCRTLTTIPQLSTNNLKRCNNMFYGCGSLLSVPELDMSSVNYVYNSMFAGCSNLQYVGGIKDFGKGFSTHYASNASQYTMSFSNCPELTEQSLINILNSLYDIATKGCNPQKVVLGATNLAKLTSEEGQQALAQAQQFGWNIS